MDVVMTLFAPAKVLCNMWSYNFYDNIIHCWVSSSYDKVNFRMSSATSGCVCVWGGPPTTPPPRVCYKSAFGIKN